MYAIIIDYYNKNGKLNSAEFTSGVFIDPNDPVAVFNYVFGLSSTHKIEISSLIEFDCFKEEEDD